MCKLFSVYGGLCFVCGDRGVSVVCVGFVWMDDAAVVQWCRLCQRLQRGRFHIYPRHCDILFKK